MADIFTPWKIGNLELPNRLVRSATWEGMAEENGAPSEKIVKLTADIAAGGAGLVITGYSYIRTEGVGMVRQTGVHDDSMVEPWARLVDTVHKAGGKVAIQIVHAGGSTMPDFAPGRDKVFGPSAMTDPVFGCQVHELTRNHILGIVEDFGKAAARAKRAGFDAVQLHGAHGYLISQFLSPDRNQRGDEYGGSLESRARFLYQVYEAARGAVGRDYPLFIKINGEDCTENGFKLEDSVRVTRELSNLGIDAIEVSGGVPAANRENPIRRVRSADEEGYFFAEAVAIKSSVSCPVISVGGWRSRARIEDALNHVDAVSMARPFIRQPDLANLLKSRATDKVDCISCRRCQALTFESGVGCQVLLDKKLKEEKAPAK